MTASIVYEEYRFQGKKYDGAVLAEGVKARKVDERGNVTGAHQRIGPYWVIISTQDVPWHSAPHHPNRNIARVVP